MSHPQQADGARGAVPRPGFGPTFISPGKQAKADETKRAAAEARSKRAAFMAARARLAPVVNYPIEVQQVIRLLETMTDQEFHKAVMTNIIDPQVLASVAFSSDDLAERALEAAVFLQENVGSVLARKAGESDREWDRRVDHVRRLVVNERQRLQMIVNGMYARQGRMPNAPSARGRASRELERLHPVEFLELEAKHAAIIKKEKEEAKAARRRAASERKQRKRDQQGG